MNSNAKYFDCHFHIIDKSFPVVPNQGFMPDAFISEDYLERLKTIDLCGGAVVSGSFQAFDQSYLFHALKVLGLLLSESLKYRRPFRTRSCRNSTTRGFAPSVSTSNAEDRKKSTTWKAWRGEFYQLVGWHTELYVDSAELADLFETLVSLPAVSIDHLGLSKAGFPTLLKLAEKGVRVKATGFGRVDFDARPALTDLYTANPRALMFGTDLPSTRAPRPYQDDDYTLVLETLGEERWRTFSTKTRLLFTGQQRF